MRVLTINSIRNTILSRYNIGDTISLRNQNDDEGYAYANYEILDFCENYVICQLNGAKECFKYYDILDIDKKPKKRKAKIESGHIGINRHGTNDRWVVTLRIDGAAKYIGSYLELADAVKAKDDKIHAEYGLYRCDPKKNIECCKKGCSHIHNRGSCEYTSNKDYALDDKKENDITYSDVYEQFIKYNSIDRNLVLDYRPCTDIPNTIVVWFKNGGMNIYTYQ